MPAITHPKTGHEQGGLAFEDHLRTAVHGVRGALAEIMAGIEVDATKPQQMSRQVGLDKSLSWKLARILGEDDAYATAVHLPGKAGLRIVLRSFEKAGASEASLTSLRRAIAEFDRMVDTHCGDRETLEMMLGHLRRDGQAQHDESHRKKSFQGNSAIWGMQARLQIAAHFVAPGANDSVDLAIVSGLVDLRRLRSDVPWAVASVRQFTGEGVPLPQEVFQAIDPNVGPGEVPLMREFCSASLPPLRIAPGQPGVTRYEIGEGPVGNTAAMTCITGWMNRAVAPRFKTEEDQYGEFMTTVTTPAELLIVDLYLHRACELAAPDLALYSMLPGGPQYPQGGREHARLPLREGMIDLGAAPPDLIVPEMPRYRQIVESVFERLGHNANEFAGYRLRMRYPPIPTLPVFRSALPERA